MTAEVAREVVVKLKAQVDASVARAFDDMADHADRASEAVDDLGQSRVAPPTDFARGVVDQLDAVEKKAKQTRSAIDELGKARPTLPTLPSAAEPRPIEPRPVITPPVATAPQEVQPQQPRPQGPRSGLAEVTRLLPDDTATTIERLRTIEEQARKTQDAVAAAGRAAPTPETRTPPPATRPADTSQRETADQLDAVEKKARQTRSALDDIGKARPQSAGMAGLAKATDDLGKSMDATRNATRSLAKDFAADLARQLEETERRARRTAQTLEEFSVKAVRASRVGEEAAKVTEEAARVTGGGKPTGKGKAGPDWGRVGGGAMAIARDASGFVPGLGQAVQGVEVAQGLLGTVGTMTGAAALPIAAVTAAVVGLGAAAVSVSPQLQNGLGGALNEITGAAGKAREALQSAREQAQQIGSAKGFGGGTARQEEVAARRYAGIGPLQEQMRATRRRELNYNDQAAAERNIKEKPFLNPLRDLSEANERTTQLLTDPRYGPKAERDREIAEQQAKAFAITQKPYEAPAPLQREKALADVGLERAQDEVKDLRGESDAFAKRDKLTREAAEFAKRRQLVDQQIADAEKALPRGVNSYDAIWMPGLGVEKFREGLLDPLLKQRADAESAERRWQLNHEDDIGKVLGGKSGPTAAEGANIAQQLNAAQERLVAAKERQLAAEKAINAASLDQLKTFQEQARAQEKMYLRMAEQEKLNLSGQKANLGLMEPDQVKRKLAIAKKLQAGTALDADELAEAQGDPLFAQKIQELGAKRAGGNADIAELLKLLGAEEKVNALTAAAKAAAEANAKLQEQIAAKIEKDTKGLADKLSDELAPLFGEQQLKELARQMAQRMRALAAEEVKRALEELQAARRAGA